MCSYNSFMSLKSFWFFLFYCVCVTDNQESFRSLWLIFILESFTESSIMDQILKNKR